MRPRSIVVSWPKFPERFGAEVDAFVMNAVILLTSRDPITGPWLFGRPCPKAPRRRRSSSYSKSRISEGRKTSHQGELLVPFTASPYAQAHSAPCVLSAVEATEGNAGFSRLLMRMAIGGRDFGPCGDEVVAGVVDPVFALVRRGYPG